MTLCLFRSRGEVCVLAPAHFPESLRDDPLSERSLLALATLTKVQYST